MGDLLDQATEVWTKAEEKPKGTFNKLRILSDLIMNMATGRKNNGGGSTAPKAAFEDTWERFLMLAEYETNIDPYRGMMKARVDNSEREEVDFSPWQKSCEWSRNTFNKNTSIEDDDDGSKRIVENTECSCPSIIFWTRQAHSKESSKRGKKRQRNAEIESERFTLGKRSSAVCECDFNPFCLFSLGGVMDDILEEKCLKISTEPSRDSDDSSNKESPPTSDLILVDDEMHSGGEPTTTNDAQKSSHVDVDLVTEKENAVADRSPSKRENPEAVDPTNIYSKTTAEELKQLRKSVEINTDLIRSYVREVLLNIPSNPFALMEKEYTNLVCAWHKSLVFWNPLVTYPTETNESLMALSVPPGIKNLGATCYLNTQLQCLAQNLAFLEGIFSWRPSDNQNLQMNSVMTKLQVLLANMVHGAARTVSTTEFSDALGLEHDEQQDPNEFARLLFERMHESFQKSSSQGNGPCKGLDNLLPSIFQGVAAYKTTCLTCRTVSKRNENFMDLNLPLSRPSTETKKGKLSGMKEFLGKKSDLNLQECLNSYTCVELLNEENQYWCSHCDGKSDAQRMLTFQQLPPVLNVQLSRYVFDRQKCVKKKLTDPVSLPRVLSVPSDTKQQPSDTKQQPSDTKQQQNSEGQVVEERINTVVAKYILCAVMRHQGTSAYRGHYLAEAMDWHTGQWFEFNDDNVKLLPTGPSHSYFPCIDTQQMNNGGAKKAASSSISGSQDAYNMYYVEESFLATSVQQSITRLHRESETQLQPLEGKNVCGDVTSSRQMKYKLITEMCLADGSRAARLQRRRNLLRQFIVSEPLQISAEPPVWVEGELLRKFFSCSDGLEAALSGELPMLRHKHLLCHHESPGLHPRIARKGKLLPRTVYNHYIHLLASERAELEDNTARLHFYENDAADCVITPESGLYCKECSEAYTSELALKLQWVKKLKFLNDELDPKKDESPFDASTSEEAQFHYTYAVSRRFISKFRAQVGSLLRSVEDAHKKGDNTASVLEGLDGADLSWLERFHDDSWLANHGDDEKVLDPLVNGNITCEHGHCGLFNNRRQVRHVSFYVWKTLQSIFPNAIEHKRSLKLKDDENADDDSCQICMQERLDKNSAEIALRSWNRETLMACNSLYKRLSPHDNKETLMLLKESSPDETFHLVHEYEVLAWRKALSIAKLKSNHADYEEAKNRIADFLLPGGRDEFEDATRNEIDFSNAHKKFLLKLPISLFCSEHEYVVGPFVYENLESADDHSVVQLKKEIVLLSTREYKAYVESVLKLSTILLDIRYLDQSMSLERLMSLYQWRVHPTIQKEPTEIGSERMFLSVNGGNEEVTFGRSTCFDGVCEASCLELIRLKVPQDNADSDEPVDSHVSSHRTSSRPSIGANLRDPITLDSDVEDNAESKQKAEFRIFEIEENATLDAALLTLTQTGGLASIVTDTDNFFLRRSSRKRKSRYPSGSIRREEALTMSLNCNLAALRLALFEKCDGFKVNHKLTLVVPKTFDSKLEVASRQSQEVGKEVDGKDLPHEWDSKSLREILSEAGGLNEGGSSDTPDFVLLRQAEGNAGPNKSYQDGMAEALMECLLEVAASGKSHDEKSKKTARAPREKGFSGTLLLSGVSTNDVEQECKPETNNDHRSPRSQSSDISNSGQNTTERTTTNTGHAKVKRRRVTVDLSDDEQLSDNSEQGNKSSNWFQSPTRTTIPSNVAQASATKDEFDFNAQYFPTFHDDTRAKFRSHLTESISKRFDLARRRVSGKDDLVEKVVTDLMNHSDFQFLDESKCRNAVLSARKANPEEQSADAILDISLAMLLSDDS